MENPDRLTALDASFLNLEATGPAHMHVASVLVFGGAAPAYDELVDHLVARLHLVPRYRQRLAHVPLGQGRPVWVDDPYFNPRYHVRHAALPAPGDDHQLKLLAGRLFSQRLDPTKPLWEISLVEGLEPTADGAPRFALVAKTHHALVDGVSGVDVTSVLFDTAPDPAPVAGPRHGWIPRPVPTGAQLLAGALVERAASPPDAVRSLGRAAAAPVRALRGVADALGAVGAFATPTSAAPPSPLNVPIGPHRRYDWVTADLARFRAVKDALGGTVNDAVLTVVSLMLGRWLREQGHPTRGLTLRALVPVSVRGEGQEGALGNRVAAVWAPLPVGITDPRAAFAECAEAMRELKGSGQAVGAQVLTELADFAPPTILSQAARLQSRQRFFNLTVTNVPGPQTPLFLLGRELVELLPVVPLAQNTALGVAIMSYVGRLRFGLLADFDALPDLPRLAGHLSAAIDDLAVAAGVEPAPRRAPRAGRRTGRAPRARAR